MMQKIISKLLCLGSLWVGLIFSGSDAIAEGLNSANFYPDPGNDSSILWPTTRVVGPQGMILGYTFDYALHPVELGDGQGARKEISDHLQLNHLSIEYGLHRYFSVGGIVPIAFYSGPSSANQTIAGVSKRSRNFFFLADPQIIAKAGSINDQMRSGFSYGGIVALNLPIGSNNAMLSDDAFKFSIDIPFQYSYNEANSEVYFIPGYSLWSNGNRVSAIDPNTNTDYVVLSRKKSLRLATGLRYWLQGGADRDHALQTEMGVRGEFSDNQISFNNIANPVEWAFGVMLRLSSKLTLHGSYGTGIGSGVGAPLTRLVGGIRYAMVQQKPVEPTVDISLTSDAFNDRTLDSILEEAQKETAPAEMSDSETQMKLIVNSDVLNVGSVRFEYNSAKLTPEAKKTVALLYDHLRSLNPKNVKIDGHTDSVGSYNYNLALSKRRAEAVKTELIRIGMKDVTIRTEGFSYKYPITSNATIAGRSMNRRIEISIDDEVINREQLDEDALKEMIYPRGVKPTSKQDR